MKVIVTGMHRSGTSMMAGLLMKCGLYLGNNLIGILHDNPKGHFEDRNFMRINAEIFEANAGRWGMPPKKIEIVPPKLINQMRAFVGMWPKDRPVGWKDPRACLTVQIWRGLIEPESLKVVHIKRPAMEIAHSLKKRNKFRIQKSLDLTKFYLDRFYKNVDGIPYIETSYHDYFNDWRSTLGSVCEFIGLRIPKDIKPITDFIEPKLWHHREKDEG
jgi:hypothetical protein